MKKQSVKATDYKATDRKARLHKALDAVMDAKERPTHINCPNCVAGKRPNGEVCRKCAGSGKISAGAKDGFRPAAEPKTKPKYESFLDQVKRLKEAKEAKGKDADGAFVAKLRKRLERAKQDGDKDAARSIKAELERELKVRATDANASPEAQLREHIKRLKQEPQSAMRDRLIKTAELALEKKITRQEAAQMIAKATDASPFDRDTDKGAAKIVKREAAAGKTTKQIAKEYGFSLSFVEEEVRKDLTQKASKSKRFGNIALDAKNFERGSWVLNTTTGELGRVQFVSGDTVTVRTGTDPDHTYSDKWPKANTEPQNPQIHRAMGKVKDAEAVQKEINKDKRIGGKEAKAIHALLKGRTGDTDIPHVGMMGVNSEKALKLKKQLENKGFEYQFPIGGPTAEMVRHGFVKRNEPAAKNEWKTINERKNGCHNITNL